MENQDKNLVNDSNKDFVQAILGTIARLVNKLRLHIDFPTETMRFNTEQQQGWWHMLTIEGVNVMQVVHRCEVTNITKNFNIRPVAVVLRKGKIFGMVRVGSEDGMVSCNWTLPIEFEFWARKPFVKRGQSFSSDIAVYDQFSHMHVIRSVSFEYR